MDKSSGAKLAGWTQDAFNTFSILTNNLVDYGYVYESNSGCDVLLLVLVFWWRRQHKSLCSLEYLVADVYLAMNIWDVYPKWGKQKKNNNIEIAMNSRVKRCVFVVVHGIVFHDVKVKLCCTDETQWLHLKWRCQDVWLKI